MSNEYQTGCATCIQRYPVSECRFCKLEFCADCFTDHQGECKEQCPECGERIFECSYDRVQDVCPNREAFEAAR